MSTTKALAYFTELGERIEARWRDAGFADTELPPLAAEELRRTPPHEHVSPWELAQLGRNPRRMPQQGSTGFGQPPLAVWGCETMYIEVLYWLQATTAIHQHSFSGAFAVLEGSSLHTQYRFKPDRKVSADLHIGELVWTSSEYLPKGAVHEIRSGPQFIHALFHLEHPSVSVVVRNYHDEGAPPQLGYLPPGIGVEHSIEDLRLERALDLYRMLADLGRFREAEQVVTGIAKQPDLMAVYLAMAAVGETDGERAIAARLQVRARAQHGPVIDRITEALAQREETSRFTALRGRVTDPDLRFFLALLLVVPTPAALRQMIDQRARGRDFITTVIGWLAALEDAHPFPFPLDAATLRAIEQLMRGKPVRDAHRVTSTPYLARLVAAARIKRR